MRNILDEKIYSLNLPNLVDCLIECSQKLISLQLSGFEVYKKKDKTSVTSADLEADKIIKSELAGYQSLYDIVSEEDAEPSLSSKTNFFLVDPLDGTSSFIQKKKDFTINIALIIDGLAKFGFIAIPYRKKLWFGGESFGIYSLDYTNLDNFKINKIDFKPQKFKDIRIIESINSKQQADYYQSLLMTGYHVGEIIKKQAATKFIAIIEDEADLYYRRFGVMTWDLAAGDALISAYGGISSAVLTESSSSGVEFKLQSKIRYSQDQSKTSPFYAARGEFVGG